MTDGTLEVEQVSQDALRRFVGGRGIASKILIDEVSPDVEPLGPQNKLVLAAGPLAGTIVPASARYEIVAKSPLTGTISCCNAGGHFGAALKMAGYDAIVVEGASQTPVYIWLDDERVTVEPAADLWGMGIHETTGAIRNRTDESVRVLGIGPSGEALVRIAAPSDAGFWSSGGAGLGAVMGSKKLKAIAVRGTGFVTVSDREALRKAMLRAQQNLQGNRFTCQQLPAYGTGALIRTAIDAGVLPTRNFQIGCFPEATKITGEAVADQLLVGTAACFGCPLACGRIIRLGPKPSTARSRGPEYEHLAAFGSCCGIDDLDAIAWASGKCREYGLDPTSAGLAIACAMELAEGGVMSAQDAGGQLGFGDAASLRGLLESVCSQEGLGQLLGRGAFEVAHAYNRPDAFVGIGREEMGVLDPRGDRAIALHCATAITRADQLAGALRLWGKTDGESMGRRVKNVQDASAALSSAGFCPLTASALDLDDIATALSAATGVSYTPLELLQAGERIWNAEHAFNLRCGAGVREHKLPERMRQPLAEGPAAGRSAHVEDDLPGYYEAREWDDDGKPSAASAGRLGLQVVAS